MAVYNKLLLATDFSDSSMMATKVAAQLAAHFSVPMILAHVFDSTPFRFGFPTSRDELGKKLEQAAVKELERYRKDHLSTVSKVMPIALDAESAPTAIAEYAKDNDVDLCIVGTHGRTGIARLLIGSVAENIVRHAHCDVLTVRPGTEDADVPSKILAPTDFSDGSLLAVSKAHDLAVSFNAELIVLHVFDPTVPIPAGSDAPGPFMSQESIEAELKQALVKLHEAELGESERVKTELLVSDSYAEGICAYAEDNAIDRIVVGSHGRGALSRFLIGSVAERVVRNAECPVLTIRASQAQPDS